MTNKKAQSTMGLFEMIVFGLVFILLAASFLLVYGTVSSELEGQNMIAGQVNASNASVTTIGKLNTAFLNSADLISIFFLFGMVLAMFFNGFLTREETPKLFFMIDFIIIILSYILAVYISNSYETILGILPFADLIITNMNTASRFMLNLPLITVVTGFITMILSYSGIPKSGEPEVAGF